MNKINKNIVIAGLARDCEKNLNKNIERIENLRKFFIWSHVVVVENDSIDDTKLILKNWNKNFNDVSIISKNYGTLTIPKVSDEIISPNTSFYRISKMAYYRNIYLDFIKTLNHEIDYVIIIDLDIEFFVVDGIINSLVEAPENFGGIFANGFTTKRYFGFESNLYYDIFAVYEYPLRSKFTYTFDSLEKTFKTINKNVNENHFYSVISAFSGLAIYNYKSICKLEYKALISDNNNAICEHIPFNEEIINLGFKNYISKELHVSYGKHNLGLDLKYILPKKTFDFLYKVLFLKIKKRLKHNVNLFF